MMTGLQKKRKDAFRITPTTHLDRELLASMQDDPNPLARTEDVRRMIRIWGEEGTGDLLGLSQIAMLRWRQKHDTIETSS